MERMFDDEAIERGVLLARLDRLEREADDALAHGSPPLEGFVAEVRALRERLPRGLDDPSLLLVDEAEFEAVRALSDRARDAFPGDHSVRLARKLRERLGNRDNVLLVGGPERTRAVLDLLEDPDGVERVVRIDASSASSASGVLDRLVASLGIPAVEDRAYPGLRYLDRLDAIAAVYPNAPLRGPQPPSIAVLVEGYEFDVDGGRMFCNLRDELWALGRLRWVLTGTEEQIRHVLRPPPDFFTARLDCATGFDGGVRYA